MTPLERQIAELKNFAQGAEANPLASGAVLINIPRITLPAGWTKDATRVRFIAPVGYPFAAPDCFWADSDLLLSTSPNLPQASNVQAIPEVGDTALWFSWHVQTWNPNRDNLITYLNVIKRRLTSLQ